MTQYPEDSQTVAIPSESSPKRSSFWRALIERGRRAIQRSFDALAKDWHGARYFSLGLMLLLVTSLVVAAYYLNHPQVEIDPDTPSYLTVTQHIMTRGNLVNPLRLPGYPLLIALVFLVAGQGNLAAVSIVQGVLFVIATLEAYVITCLTLRRAWIGLMVGLIIGTNIDLLSFIKPDTAEGLSLWIVASLALAVTIFIRSPRASLLWVVALFVLLAFMTRPEWIYIPIPLFAYLLALAAQSGKLLRLLPHALLATLALYGCLGLFIHVNATQYDFPGITEVQSINLLGKVMEYHMQNEAPPQYATVTKELNRYLATHANPTPYGFALYYPAITDHHWAVANAYASAIVAHHPLEFALDTIPDFFESSNVYYSDSKINPAGAFATPLIDVQDVSAPGYFLYRFFPIFALFWFGLLLRYRASRQGQIMSALALLSVYELAVDAAGGYGSFARLHTPFDPLMLIVMWGTLLLCLVALGEALKQLPWSKPLARSLQEAPQLIGKHPSPTPTPPPAQIARTTFEPVQGQEKATKREEAEVVD